MRADWALVGAVSLLAFGIAPLAGINLCSTPSAGSANTSPTELSVVVANETPSAPVSPVELAAAGFASESHCLAEVMYYEARGEGPAGQKAVAEVVLRRTHDRNYASTVCGVVHEGVQPGRKTGCQFSFACDGALEKRLEGGAWQEARLLADKIMTGAIRLGNQTGSAIAFHSVDVAPAWKDTMFRTIQIGNHIFYRMIPRDQVARLARPQILAAANDPY